MVMIKVYVAIVRTFVNQDLTQILGNIFSQIESLTDGTVWTRTLAADTPRLNCYRNTLKKTRCTRTGFFMDWSAKP